jgi:hypothetical protein
MQKKHDYFSGHSIRERPTPPGSSHYPAYYDSRISKCVNYYLTDRDEGLIRMRCWRVQNTG